MSEQKKDILQENNEDFEEQEEIIDDEQLEIEREVESYQYKIAQLDQRLNEMHNDKVNEIKREAMRKSNYSDEQIERYIEHIEGETSDEIEASILKLIEEIPPSKREIYADPSPFNGSISRPKALNRGDQIGKTMFERIKNRIFWRSIM